MLNNNKESDATQMCRIGLPCNVGIIGGEIGTLAITEAVARSFEMEKPLIIEDFGTVMGLPHYEAPPINTNIITIDSFRLPEVTNIRYKSVIEENWFNEAKHKKTCAKNRKKRKRLKRSKK